MTAPVNVTLEDLCREQGQPFVSLPGDARKVRTLRTVDGQQLQSFRQAPMRWGRVRDVTIFGKSYVTAGPYRAVFVGQSHRNYKTAEFANFYTDEIETAGVARPTIAQECCFLGGFSGDVRFFGHFVFEYLYRLVAFDMGSLLRRLPVVVYQDVPEAWLSFLELYGIPRADILRVPQYPAPSFKSVWVTSCPNYLGAEGYALWDHGIHEMHERLRLRAEVDGRGPRRVFIGRRDAAHRRLINESELWRYLESEGFVYADFAGKPAAEQVAMVGSAEIIVTVGGSASVMTHFAPKTCTIIEILPPHLTGGLGSMCFAAVLGQRFSRTPARVADHRQAADAESDIVVDVERVREMLERAAKSKELA